MDRSQKTASHDDLDDKTKIERPIDLNRWPETKNNSVDRSMFSSDTFCFLVSCSMMLYCRLICFLLCHWYSVHWSSNKSLEEIGKRVMHHRRASSSSRGLNVLESVLDFCCFCYSAACWLVSVQSCDLLAAFSTIMAYVVVEILDLDTSISRSRHFEIEEEGVLSWPELKSAFPDATMAFSISTKRSTNGSRTLFSLASIATVWLFFPYICIMRGRRQEFLHCCRMKLCDEGIFPKVGDRWRSTSRYKVARPFGMSLLMREKSRSVKWYGSSEKRYSDRIRQN